LQLLVGASALLNRFGNVREIIQNDNFQIAGTVHTIIEGETPATMAKSTGLGIIELATMFENLKPDIVLTVADRFETLSTAIAASYMNIPLAHTQGGEITGSIDESVRHAITKLAHIHFPATKKSANNLIKMGENPKNIHLTGCPAMDVVLETNKKINPKSFDKYKGVGAEIDFTSPYLVVLQHPVTTEYGNGLFQINQTIDAIAKLKIQTIWLWPNVDAGSDDISKGLRVYRESKSPDYVHFFKNFSPEDYIKLISNCVCLVGNSSSALREGNFLGVPAVNIGTRQSGRECGSNVMHVGHSSAEIAEAIQFQISHGFYEQGLIFGDGFSGEKIANILAEVKIQIQKKLHY
jgi:UDP-hydrolysing UDP-N-acetyl-D-glucosamine 2-epimerase